MMGKEKTKATHEERPMPSFDARTLVDEANAEADSERNRAIKQNPRLGKALSAHGMRVSSMEGDVIYLKNSKNDPASPRSWPTWKRYCVVGLAAWLNNVVTIGVSSYSDAVEDLTEEFGVSAEVGTLGLSLFVAGFAAGPLLCAPLSEFYGRRPVYLVFWLCYTLLWLGMGLAKNIGTVLAMRFLLGFAGSTPLANTGGVVHDLFSMKECGYAVALYALSSTDGPPFGSVVAAYLGQNAGWRWIQWFNMILAGVMLVIIYFLLPETRDTIVLMRRARALRKETGNDKIFAEHEKERSSKGHFYKVSLLRPWKFFFTEPITYICALINGYCYGIIFLSNEAFGLVYGSGNGGYSWTHSGTVNLTFLTYVIGSLIGFSFQPLQEYYYRRGYKGIHPPERRWITAMYLTPLMPIGLMIAAWTAYPHVHWIGSLIGFTCFGIGFFSVINAILNYVVDSYGHFAASSLAAVVCVRNIVGAGFPLFGRQMFQRLGNNWALFLLSMLAIFMVPIPFLFVYKGDKIRKASPYCNEHFDQDT